MRPYFGISYFKFTDFTLWQCSHAVLMLPLFSLLGMVSSGVVVAGDKTAVTSEIKGPLSEYAYTWNDGERQRTYWLNPSLVAEFGTGPINETSHRMTSGQKAILLPREYGSPRFWKIEGNTSEVVLRSLQTDQATSRFSPVFHDYPAESGNKYALPGNIFIYLKPSWNESQVNQWAQSNGMEIIRRMSTRELHYVVRTGPGFEALETANRIHQSGEVEAAIPNWWHKRVPR